MPDVFGHRGAGLRERVGSLAQVTSVESFVEANGVAQGSRRIRAVNGGGIEFDLHPDRALDIGRVTVDGAPVAWLSPTGISGPDAAEHDGQGWLRTFGGGLLATCGLDTFGPPDADDDEAFGQHGRVGTVRAEVTRAEATPDGVVIEGVVRQARVFGENLVLRRRISSPLGSDTIHIDDVVTNEAFRAQPHMILYHLNFGWPLVSDHTAIRIPSTAVRPRDADAVAGSGAEHTFPAPTPAFREQVFTHTLPADGFATIVVANPANGLEAAITVSAGELPWVHQWKMAGQGHYALGIEPANSPSMSGRSTARAAGQVVVLAPGAAAHYSIAVRLRRDQPALNEGENAR